MEKQFISTLRGHESSLQILQFVYLPSTTGYAKNNSVIPLMVPTLMSSDENGNVIWWDLNTRRPLYCWKAHDGSILSVKQLGIIWNGETPSITKDFGKILTHGKDGFIRITQLFELDDLEKPTAGFKYTVPLSKKLSFDNPSPPNTFELPVNVLNFCNVDITSKGWLITPATVDAEGWDLYLINGPKLTRPIHNHKLTIKTGIIMKFQWIDLNRLVIGYESGLVIIIEINDKFEIRELFNSDLLTPDPITSISIDDENHRVFVSTTGAKIGVIDYELNEIQIQNVKHKGVNYIDCNSSTMILGIITWDGYFRVYSYVKNFEFLFKIKRTTPSITADDDPITQRALTMQFSRRQFSPSSAHDLIYQNGVSKNIIKRNRHELVNKQWMVIGFEDGRLGLYTI